MLTISPPAQSEAVSTGEATVAADAGGGRAGGRLDGLYIPALLEAGSRGLAAALRQPTHGGHQPEVQAGELLKAEAHHGRSPNAVTRAAEEENELQSHRRTGRRQARRPNPISTPLCAVSTGPWALGRADESREREKERAQPRPDGDGPV